MTLLHLAVAVAVALIVGGLVVFAYCVYKAENDPEDARADRDRALEEVNRELWRRRR
jgi:hypothetical protein